MKGFNRPVAAVLGVVVLLVFLVGVSLLGGGWGYGRWGMMGPGMMGGWGVGPFGWLGALFMWLIPIILIALLVLGVVWLVRAVGSGEGGPQRLVRSCPSCGRGVQSDWVNCPYCGTSIAEA